MITLPEKTVERLCKYRRVLYNTIAAGKQHIFSHELANLLQITPVQVRRDIMLIGYSGTLRKGYDIKDLISLIGNILDTPEGQKAAIIGLGNLGSSILTYFNGKRAKLSIIAAFDIDPQKTNRVFGGVQCYPVDRLEEVIKAQGIRLAILTVPANQSPDIVEVLAMSGVKGIMNFTPKALHVPDNIYLEEYDMVTSMEKVAYFIKQN
ncbi:MAG: redox-sensing transcriptional repressor Rex [Bacteroidales bacterium]|nr:redox-sensing transcriptional repressor Rex [Bacteroidales bacterium]MDD3011019.1 redox-sensing transcriptional repressor Rex [Bacteroidales bacterium]MDD3960883.1 redox-sensing transcriptional repressor Rex [Bacteroidales bacterium]HPE86898.1 redox-sensing transcriptional repressor Rex [Bacteroidales bacterium]